MRAELAAESSDLRERLGFRKIGWAKVTLVYFLLLGTFGVFLPWLKGRDFLDSVMLGAYASLGVIFAAPAAAAEFDQAPTTPRVLARVAVAVLYGELMAGSILLLGLATVYLSRRGRIAVGPDLRSLWECSLLGISLSLAVCAAATWVSLRFSTSASKASIRLVFLALLAAFYLRSGWLPSIAARGALIALLISVVFLFALAAKTAAGGRSEKS